jgi:hypothetical protein
LGRVTAGAAGIGAYFLVAMLFEGWPAAPLAAGP